MADKLTPLRRSANMSRIRSRDTKPEMLLRRALWASGCRGYRTHPRGVEGKPDVAFIGLRVAVFVDGCFWHGCPVCFVAPGSNKDYWESKMLRNRQRDEQVTASLIAAGWTVIRLWEHEVEADAASCAANVASVVAKRRKG